MKEYTERMDRMEVPVHLNDRVLAEIRMTTAQQTAEQARRQKHKAKPAPKQKKSRLLFIFTRAAAVAAIALVLVFAGGLLSNLGKPQNGDEPAASKNSFSIVAYASEPGAQFVSNENMIIFGAPDRFAGPFTSEYGYYTRSGFSIEGEGIVSVDIELSKGEICVSAEQCFLFPKEKYPNQFLPEEVIEDEAAATIETIADKLCGPVDPGSFSWATVSRNEVAAKDLPEGIWIVSASRRLGSTCTIQAGTGESALDLSEVKFEFWIAPEDLVMDMLYFGDPNLADPDPQTLWVIRTPEEQSLDKLSGQTLKITVHFADGSTAEKSYMLATGYMKIVHEFDLDNVDPESGKALHLGWTVLPELVVDDRLSYWSRGIFPAPSQGSGVYTLYGVPVED